MASGNGAQGSALAGRPDGWLWPLCLGLGITV